MSPRRWRRYTKLGYAGNSEPQYIFPSSAFLLWWWPPPRPWRPSHVFPPRAAIAVKETQKVGAQMVKGVEDLDFYIGDEAADKPGYAVKCGRPPCLCVGVSRKG